eukprot:TRINITY_DN9594_c0_g1::TRINITY_DN9594_c0_g1_i1::g.12256::m.12256 TRINITY_DN9594_c0_g1::TRINITY_DN9594_c0_g1_i1::g.12256  ORF type:complete len:208 (-),score=20.00,zf-RING_2/PF13639.1/4.1e+03,zf-RING_2/PF13639.1/1.2e-11,zf-rbx1/PF12678.2/1.5e+03,zf-rbx1/PF12678.2/4.4e-09,zf-RanBP/PF00641.13/2.2e-06,zf-RanBP/PF00641.13/1.5e+03,zf-RanBP/PF00641.13/5.1e+03,zf-C3HC4_2/PF13923.1/1.8e+03,zf-C3HC4_2/PF13923.1/2.2e-06,zf-Apc11/PF12861.2/9.4e+03,zf-Apc11/PF12861.2/2.5e+03,zf-Apc11/PF12861.2/0.00015,zf-C3HC
MSSWPCETCTLINSPWATVCDACYRPRIEVKDLKCRWDWAPNDDQWIPYDFESITQIEGARLAGHDEVVLNKGWFSSQRGYKVVGLQSNSPVQINTSSHNRRNVRRVGGDDNELFQPVDPSTLTSDTDTCSICVTSMRSDADDGPVLLRGCARHYFHRGCITQWLNLKSTCPYCLRSI